MKDSLLALEDRLAQGQDFDALLHPEFFEFGRSGRRWSRAESLAELSEADLRRLFATSQPSVTSPEAGYAS